MAYGIYKVTETFEQQLADYTGAKYAVTVDNMSNGLFLALYYENHVKNREQQRKSIIIALLILGLILLLMTRN